ncbi:hypothetical protein G9A89_006453 [Geosiphon pyriformis]|nr:hypothetical protein G9A89_006453 [Geosiphon pyriformis]
MPEHVHDTDAGFDLRYPRKDPIKLEPHSGGIIDAGYVGNIIAMLQNDSEKTYIIEPNKKIAQTIFLPLVKIAQLVLMGNRKELGITAKGIQRFGSIDKIDIPVNIVEKEHQIKTEDEMPIKQRAYRIPPASHEIICQEINQMFDNRLIQPSISPWLLPVVLV